MARSIMVAAAIVASIGAAQAETYPSRPITMIAPFPAGGPSDALARILSEPMRAALGQPVVIESNNGAKVVGSLLQMRRPGSSGGYTGITQLMAVPEGELSDTYVFPYYHGTDSTRYQSIEVSNLETFDTNVTITIGSTVYGPYLVSGNSAGTFRYTTVSDGPVVVESSGGAQVIAQIYELKRASAASSWTGQSQVMGVPYENLTDTVILPWYNGTLNDLSATLIFGVP